MENLEQFKEINDAIMKAAEYDKLILAFKRWEKETNKKEHRYMSNQLKDLGIKSDSWINIIYNALPKE